MNAYGELYFKDPFLHTLKVRVFQNKLAHLPDLIIGWPLHVEKR